MSRFGVRLSFLQQSCRVNWFLSALTNAFARYSVSLYEAKTEAKYLDNFREYYNVAIIISQVISIFCNAKVVLT